MATLLQPYKVVTMLLQPQNFCMGSNSTLPFEFRWLQFPVVLCFAMTINKSQGQTFKAVGVDLTNESFTHGMLYVALSRVGSPNCLTLLVREDRKTRNVVYNEVFI